MAVTGSLEIVLIESLNNQYEEIKRVSMEYEYEKFTAQALALNFAEFKGLNIQAIHATREEIRVFHYKR